MVSTFCLPSGAAAGVLSVFAHGQAVLVANLPRAICEAGERAAFHSVEFFTACLPNPNTRAAYERAVTEFCRWCDQRGLPLPALSSPIVAAYFHELRERLSPASANQHLSAVRQWLEWLARTGVLTSNPAATVRGQRLSRKEGKTPILERKQVLRLFEALDRPELVARRDRALLAVMLYDFVRVGAVVRMRVRNFQDHGHTAWLQLREKGGKERRIPAHHLVRDYLRAYLGAAGLQSRIHAQQPLFQSAPRRAGSLSGRPLDRSGVLAIVKRRCRDLDLSPSICNHSFRATGITLHQENGGDIEAAALLAGHADSRTTQLYNRGRRELRGIDVERVHL